MRSSCAIAPRWVWNCLPGSRTTVCSRPLGSVSCTRSPATKAPATGSPRGASGVSSVISAVCCCASTGGQPTATRAAPGARSVLSVPRPSLGGMTAMAQDSAHGLSPTGQPADAAAASPDSPVDPTATPRRPSLSPSRAADFKTCPLLYRFRTIDRLPERKSLAAVRGTLVHSVLERLYDLPAAQRTVEAAQELLEPAWADLREEPGVAELFAVAQDEGAETDANAPESVDAWLLSAGKLVEKYFTLEEPTRIQPEGREEL